jgi:hypothetical protein
MEQFKQLGYTEQGKTSDSNVLLFKKSQSNKDEVGDVKISFKATPCGPTIVLA